MDYKPTPPDRLKIGIQDTITVIAGLFGIIIAITLVLMLIQTPAREQSNGFWEVFALFGLIALLCFAVAFWRVSRVSRRMYDVWERAVPATAQIVSINEVGYGRYRRRLLTYSYDYEGHTYEKRADVNRRWTPPGNELDILVDPQKPDDTILLFKYQ